MKKFFTKKRIIWTAVIAAVVLLIGLIIVRARNQPANVLTDTARVQNLTQTVLATGQVVRSTDLDLSFQASGVVRSISVKEGDQVKPGQVLATLDQKPAQASLTQARGALAQAQANYDKILAGASSEDVAVAQAAVDASQAALQATQSQQTVLVANAQNTMLNSG